MKNQHVLVVGAGIGGLGSALALARSGQRVTLLERALEFAPVGAGIQLGPNAMKVLTRWGLRDALLTHACLPQAIAVRDAVSGRSICRILLGNAVQQRYGEVYATVHRADLHKVLLQAVQGEPAVQLHCGEAVDIVQGDLGNGVGVQSAQRSWQADALVAADGVWSAVRQAVCNDGAARATGHVAYRTLLPMADVPIELAGNTVGVWWGRNVHVVHYPVRGGAFLNLVVLSEQNGSAAVQDWAGTAQAADVLRTVQAAHPALRDLLACAQTWQCWPLMDRQVTRHWTHGRLALLGDAAHPMLPYLAQGAAMALEDAAVLADSAAHHSHWNAALADYQQLRKARCDRVVTVARRNGRIFHLAAPWSLARDAVLALKGTQVLGMPWLYGNSK